LTFIAEWGDRSQLATIVLAGINDVVSSRLVLLIPVSITPGHQVGVILGGCLGHAICTGGAVLAGALIARFISIRKITFLGALVFLGFAIASIFIDPNEDGIDGIPEIQGYDNTTRLVNRNISLTIELLERGAELY
jgi:putative Ca2+/H+ antiporter (TMEM165/GDT1 family)